MEDNGKVSSGKYVSTDQKISFGCTSLSIKDKQGNVYHGRTLEYRGDLPFNLSYYPIGSAFSYLAPDNKTKSLSYQTKYEILVITYPENEFINVPVEGINSAGLSGSLNMKIDSELPILTEDKYPVALNWALLIEWALSTCSSVKEVKENINNIALWTDGLPIYSLSNFHFVFYDNTGDCVVVEASDNKLHIIDNPTGALTNAPDFRWHLTNLNNYTHLTNIDVKTSNQLGGMNLRQPGTGISTATLPPSDTTVDRFVRAVFFSSFALKKDSPAKAIIELSHVMNKFDRPKNINVSILEEGDPTHTASEYSEWTALTDINNKELYVRTYYDLNYTKYALKDFTAGGKKVRIPIVEYCPE